MLDFRKPELTIGLTIAIVIHIGPRVMDTNICAHKKKLGMSKLYRAIEIAQKQGLLVLLKKVISQIKIGLENLHFLLFDLKSKFLHKSVVDLNGVFICINDDIFTSTMRRRLWEGRYEIAEANLIESHLNKNLPAIDLGAGIGYTTCLLDQNIIDSTSVVAVEANNKLIPALNQTKYLNNANYEVVHSAYHYKKENIDFYVAQNFWSSSQHNRDGKNQKKVSVPAISLEDLLETLDLNSPVQLVVDIEGAEHDLLHYELDTVKENCELLIIEFHSFLDNDIKYYVSILEQNGFECIDSYRNVYCLKNTTH